MVLNTCKLFSLNVRGINNFRKRRNDLYVVSKRKGWPYLSAGNSWKMKWGGDMIMSRGSPNSCRVAILFRVWGHCFVKIWGPTGTLCDPEGSLLLCCGELGRKEKRALGARWEGEREKRGSRLFPLPIVPGALSIFSIIAMGIISWSLCEGESPEGGDQGQIVCAENIYAPTKDKVIIKFLNNLRTILQKENLDDEATIIIRGDFNCPLNPALDKKKGGTMLSRKSVIETIDCVRDELDLVDIWRKKNPFLKSFM